jgi:uncharacterized membrane protein YeiH
LSSEWVFIFEIVGTIAFAVSGAATAAKKNMDLFGIIILGACTSMGGGMIRDILLGLTPPNMFRDPIYAIVSTLSSLIVFLPPMQRLLSGNHTYESLLLIMDAIGLGVFTVVGINTSMSCGNYNAFFLVTLGVLTGIGGGILRDVFTCEPPYVFVKHFYACASILGAIVCVILKDILGFDTAALIGGTLIFILRLLAAKYRWKLPKPGMISNKKDMR